MSTTRILNKINPDKKILKSNRIPKEKQKNPLYPFGTSHDPFQFSFTIIMPPILHSPMIAPLPSLAEKKEAAQNAAPEEKYFSINH